jgi:hypothetical protein
MKNNDDERMKILMAENSYAENDNFILFNKLFDSCD